MPPAAWPGSNAPFDGTDRCGRRRTRGVDGEPRARL